MGKAHPLQGSNGHRDPIEAPRRPARTAARAAGGLVLVLAMLGPRPAHADSAGGCLQGEWIEEAKAFVADETGMPAPEVCVRPARPEYLKVLVLPAAIGPAHGESVAAVYVPATREILLAEDLHRGTTLAGSYLVHELVHAQQFVRHAQEHASCPGVLEAEAYGTQAHYLRTRGLQEEAFLLQVLGVLQSACAYSDD